MTEDQVVNQEQQQVVKSNDKDYNFRAIEARLRQETAARLDAERKAEEAVKMVQESQRNRNIEDEDESEPYVDHRKLEKKLSSFERRMEEKIDKRAEEKAYAMMQRDKQESWMRNNPDFYEVMQNAEKFAQRDPELAETILQMPEGFERQKLVYKNIKALGLHKPEQKQPSIQEKIDANRRSPYYQPSGVGSAPYAGSGDFSAAGQKNAYDKMKELQARLRL